jgi:AraC-like DNA-binding protein
MLLNISLDHKFIQKYKYSTSKVSLLHNVSTEWHKHPCIQLSLSLHSHELLTLSIYDKTYSTYGFLIPSSVEHKLDASNTCSITLLIEPIDENYHLFNHLTKKQEVVLLKHENIVAITDYLVKSFLYKKKPDTLAIYLLLNKYLACHCQFDQRILKAISFIGTLSVKRITSRQVADEVYLSESRFLHLFREQIGINFRAYLLWLRLNDAVEEIRITNSLTLIANNCGFSDTAHLSRTCKMAYGIRPSDLKDIIQQEKSPNCNTPQCLYNINKQNLRFITEKQIHHKKKLTQKLFSG